MMGATSPAQSRRTYHHGDLRQALLDAGIALARDGGPEAVVLREATRRAGVVPNAAYRHFVSRHALLQAVRAPRWRRWRWRWRRSSPSLAAAGTG